MGMKEKMAKMIAQQMSDDQKKDMIQALYDKYKDRPDVDTIVQQMKDQLGYKKDDIPKRD